MALEEESRLPEPSRRSNVVTVGFRHSHHRAMLIYFVVSQWMQVAALVRPVGKFAKKLSSSGLAPSEPKETPMSAKPAPDKIYEFVVHGKTFWICYFDPENKKQVEAEGTVRDHKTIEFDGKSRPVKVHGELVLVGFDGHPDEEKVVKAFDDYEKVDDGH